MRTFQCNSIVVDGLSYRGCYLLVCGRCQCHWSSLLSFLKFSFYNWNYMLRQFSKYHTPCCCPNQISLPSYARSLHDCSYILVFSYLSGCQCHFSTLAWQWGVARLTQHNIRASHPVGRSFCTAQCQKFLNPFLGTCLSFQCFMTRRRHVFA